MPTTSTSPKYSWLGAAEVSTELPSGQIAMGARSYIPQLGRFLQPDPVSGGSANAYTFGDPINTADPSGALTYGFSGWLKETNNQEAQEVVAREVARETLEREEAERRVVEAQAATEAAGPPSEESTPLGGYPGWLCETAANAGQEVQGCGGSGGGSSQCSKGGVICANEAVAVHGHCGSEFRNKPCKHSGGGGNGIDTACALVGIADLFPPIAVTPGGIIAGAFCAGYAAGKVVKGG